MCDIGEIQRSVTFEPIELETVNTVITEESKEFELTPVESPQEVPIVK